MDKKDKLKLTAIITLIMIVGSAVIVGILTLIVKLFAYSTILGLIAAPLFILLVVFLIVYLDLDNV